MMSTVLESAENLESLAVQIYAIAEKAGMAIMQAKKQMEIAYKSDQSAVTNLDILADKLITEALRHLSPYPILSEEQNPALYEERSHWQTYWCVDPLDGTQDLIKGTGDYTVNIALIKNHRPILGVVYVPEQQIGFLATKEGAAYKVDAQQHRVQIHTRPRDPDHMVIAMSRFHVNSTLADRVANLEGVTIKQLGSSLKICQIAAGEVDCYPRMGPTQEWDLAAAQVILEVAGGALFDLKFDPLMYNNKDTLIQPPFLAVGDPHTDWASIVRLMTIA